MAVNSRYDMSIIINSGSLYMYICIYVPPQVLLLWGFVKYLWDKYHFLTICFHFLQVL